MSDDLLNKIDAKLDKVMEEITEIKIVQTKHDINLEIHMKRSDNLEALYNHLKEQDIEPIKANLNMLKGAGKVIGATSLVISIIIGILKLLGKL